MLEEIKLENLTLLELQIMLEHLRLGMDHLKKCLNPQQLEDLLYTGGINFEQHETIKSDPLEKSGQVALIVNTIFTCVFGSWLGVAGFLGLGLGPNHSLISIIAVSLTASIYFGYLNYKFVKSQARAALYEQMLCNLELKILKILHQKKQVIIIESIDFLNKALRDFSNSLSLGPVRDKYLDKELSDKDNIQDWIEAFNDILDAKIASLQGNEIYEIYSSELKKIQNSLASIVSKNILVNTTKQENVAEISVAKMKFPETMTFIKILTNPTIARPRTPIIVKSWLRTNFTSVLIGLIPTIVGGFGSLFVYFGSLPNVAAQLGFKTLEGVLSSPESKTIAILCSIIITIYFGATYLHSNHKAFKRNQELNKTQKIITNEEARGIEIDTKLNLLTKFKEQVQKIKELFKVIQRIQDYLTKNDQELLRYKHAYEEIKQRVLVS